MELLYRTTDVADAHDRAQSVMVRHRMEVDRTTGTFDASVHRAAVGDLELLAFSYGAPTRIVSAPLDGFVAVHCPRRGHLQVSQNRSDAVLAPGAAAVISSGSPVELTWSADLDLIVLKIPEAVLLPQLAALTGNAVTDRVVFDPVHRLDAGSALAAAIELAVRAENASAGLSAAVTQAVVTGLLLGHGHTLSARVWEASSSPGGVVGSVVDIVRAQPAVPHTTATLAARVGIGERTLQLAFARQVGAPPMAYLRRVRLELARDQLLAAAPDGGLTVLDVAIGCGFGHAGRFAAGYRARFGESPSATLRRAV
ncbi:AraC family transcriptional regulator [Cryptosporangium sp. NPDC048952]|uniref:AraC family transcriptional regulator n=1 Tax=Cryptosporangium sp. NPDC048952 TaxID=3363961 RepID=UPI00371AFC3D